MRTLGRTERDERATMLLCSFLSPQQRFTLEHHGFFYFSTVRGWHYALYEQNISWVIELRDHGRPLRGRGLDVLRDIPRADILLTNMLFVRHHHSLFVQMACVGTLRLSIPPALMRGTFYKDFCDSLKPESPKPPEPPGYWPPYGGLFSQRPYLDLDSGPMIGPGRSWR